MQTNIRAGEVPELIRKTAEEIAGVLYEGNRSERFRREAGTQKEFIRRNWKHHVDTAIQMLSQLLGQKGFPETQKEEIFDAIIAFNERGRYGKQTLPMSTRRWQ